MTTLTKGEIQEIAESLFTCAMELVEGGALDVNHRTIFNGVNEETGEGLLVVLIRTHRELTVEEVEAAFGSPDSEYVDYTKAETKRPHLTLVKKDEADKK